MDMSEVIFNLVPMGGGQGSKNLCNTRDQVAKLFTRRKFLTRTRKVLTFNLHQSNNTLLKCNGHSELLGELKVGKLERKLCFHQRYLYSTSYLSSQLTLESQTEHNFSVTLQYAIILRFPFIINFIRMMNLENLKYTHQQD
jgi:hypothetical protein